MCTPRGSWQRRARAGVALLAASLACCGADGAAPSAVATRAAPPEPRVADPGATPLVDLAGGRYEPLFPGRDAPPTVPVAPFALERTPVTNAQFLAFVAAESSWRRDRAARLFVDERYLTHWDGPLSVPAPMLDRPVTNVSWFAARAYARWRGRRLPDTAEWELAASATLVGGDDTMQLVRNWYAHPTPADPGPVGIGIETVDGVRDLHGLVWEWVDDFSAAIASGDGRSATDLERGLFCGAGAVGASRPEDYVAFMRYAMRSSLRGRSTGRGLGFRCAAPARQRAPSGEPK